MEKERAELFLCGVSGTANCKYFITTHHDGFRSKKMTPLRDHYLDSEKISEIEDYLKGCNGKEKDKVLAGVDKIIS